MVLNPQKPKGGLRGEFRLLPTAARSIENRKTRRRKIETLKVNVPAIDAESIRHFREVRIIIVGERDGVLRKRADVEKEAWVRQKEFEGGKPPPPPAHEILLGEGDYEQDV